MLRGASSPIASGSIELILGLVGAISLGFGVLGDSSFKKLLETRPFQYLGSRSYSIFLVHAPIVTLVGFWVVSLTGSIADWFTVAPLAVLISLLAGELFHWAVERPSLNVARRLRRSIKI
jgi:peptidoglycan/LPS O-acetylase OafA/YrhL